MELTDSDLQVNVCVTFSEGDIIERTVIANLETIDSASSADGKNNFCVYLLQHQFYFTATVDYSPVNQNLTFSSNELMCVDVVVFGDAVLEDTETFQISLTSYDPFVLVGDVGVASIIISDNDGKF